MQKAFTNTEVVITGLCNIYTHYITTHEDQLFTLLLPAPVDNQPANSTFGQVLEQVHPRYKLGEVASVTFVAGNPRNSGDMVSHYKTFVTVERFQNNTGTWVVVHTDASWETRFHWIKGSGGQSNATVEWHIPLSAQSGTYRIRHFGHYKRFNIVTPVITAYEGVSDVFRVTKTL
uniref:Neutral/alkaline non-lysosomal ceramidase C-terminal domain-containing protein n=1 Tax=Electrophorus electricus TaxID=8005 RepID=A0A4W4E009_ELEEL